jgi:hypothetical protein
MGINNDKYEKQDSSCKINAENFNNHFLKLAENISDKIKSNNSLNINGTTYSPSKLSQNFNLKYNKGH